MLGLSLGPLARLEKAFHREEAGGRPGDLLARRAPTVTSNYKRGNRPGRGEATGQQGWGWIRTGRTQPPSQPPPRASPKNSPQDGTGSAQGSNPGRTVAQLCLPLLPTGAWDPVSSGDSAPLTFREGLSVSRTSVDENDNDAKHCLSRSPPLLTTFQLF